MDEPETTVMDLAVSDPVFTDRTSFALRSKTTALTIQIDGNRPALTSLTTESGVETISSPSPLILPSFYENGRILTEFNWQYVGYRDYDDGEGGVGYTFVFRNESPAITYALHAVARPDMAGPFEFFAKLYNHSGETLFYRPESYFSVTFSGAQVPTAWTFHKQSGMAEGYTLWNGQRYEGSGIYLTDMTEGAVATAHTRVNQNWNDSGYIPMIYLDYGTSGIYSALEWTNGTLTSVGGKNSTELSVCLADSDFRTRVPDGTDFYMPAIYLGVYDGDVDIGSNIFKHWFLAYKAPDNILEDADEPLTQQDMQIGYDVAKYGIQQIKWDYGWWSDTVVTGQWRTNEGLLSVKNSAYLGVLRGAGCATLSQFVQKANAANVKLALYVLLHDTQLDRAGVPTSVGKNGHPEWFANVNVTGMGKSADLGNAECVEFYQQYMYDFFVKNHITTYRSDFEPICRKSNLNNRHYANGNDVQYWCTVGFSDLIDYLLENIPGFRYESCSSGGSMKDFFTMTKASVINIDDSADFMSAHMSFYDSSYCIPPAQLQLPVNAMTYTPGTQYYAGIGNYLYGFRCTLTGAVMLSNWSGTPQRDIPYWTYHIAEVYNQKMKPLIKYGDLYHILPRPDGIHWDGLQYVDVDAENEIKGLVMLWKPTDTEGPEKTVYLRGLDADTLYTLTFEDRPAQNCQKTGAELMENGLTVTIAEESGSEMIWITEAK
ncbi:MAG: GH36 C-terminal domain-containing protein [Clostridia bacterium]|nr:GH36 C-terminal domain-containing protein [Clostridia bacterium]